MSKKKKTKEKTLKCKKKKKKKKKRGKTKIKIKPANNTPKYERKFNYKVSLKVIINEKMGLGYNYNQNIKYSNTKVN